MSVLCALTDRGHEFDYHHPGWLTSWRVCRDCGERQDWDPEIKGFNYDGMAVVTKTGGQWVPTQHTLRDGSAA